MNETQSTIPDPSYYPPNSRNIFGTKIPASVCFAIGLLLFLLPFAELKCKPPKDDNDGLFQLMKLNLAASNTGLGLAIGNDWKSNIPTAKTIYNDENRSDWTKEMRKQKPNTYAVIALVLAALGFVLSLANRRNAAIANIFTGSLAATSLVGLAIDLTRKTNDLMEKINKTSEKSDVAEYTVFTLVFTPWFYVCIVALLTAAFFSYKRMQQHKV
jgi:hypothetical protein